MRTLPARAETFPFDPAGLHAVLFAHYGPSHWWPGETPFEVMVGAVLTQNTAWRNVEKAIANLKASSLLSVEGIHGLSPEELARLIRPAGYYNVKAARLKNLVTLITRDFGASLERLFMLSDSDLRLALLGVNGIGRETADSICCYAANRLVFVVDAYTKRILSRHGVIGPGADYEEVRALFEGSLPRNLGVYKDLHAHLVYVGKDYCRAKRVRCGDCPLGGPGCLPIPAGDGSLRPQAGAPGSPE
ncbi:MAG TPA: endonuclease III domain-containing protein [Deltaproteobacteria bacterium]|nr:endonuclease III domain-containing protein [Deltaproteobacteria bacterium]HOM27991.1 endonuclease III domain-containing protein [Deltaproteobacteria bacterium]HPP79946.1 endonuclease III domain-containing protein [Deltaproteobacteria bacterium]